MIRLSAIFLLLFVSVGTFASDLTEGKEGENQDFTYGKHTTPGSAPEESTLRGDEEPGSRQSTTEEPNKVTSESDSSQYSVNKFNFLFYFVYKLKYMDEELETEDETQKVTKK